jgi:hypothetical protein
MDEIDITSSDFSLDVPYIIDKIVESTTTEVDEDYTIYIYIGILILILATGWVVYNYTMKKKKVTFQDKLEECYDGVCQRA